MQPNSLYSNENKICHEPQSVFRFSDHSRVRTLFNPSTSHVLIRTIPKYRAFTLSLLFAAFALAFLVPQSSEAQSPRPTNSEVVTHNVVLGDRIEIYIETEIDDDIKEAQLWVRPHGEETIPNYSYVEFTQNGNIRATAEIDVQSPSYFPPGTTFDVRFEFTSVNGQKYTSNTYHIEHLGTAHDWRRVGDDRLEIVYYDINDRSIQNLHAQTTKILPEIITALGVTEVPRFRAVIFPNLRELTIHGPTISQAATDGQYFGGFAYDEYNLTIMSSPSASILIHELTHLIFGRALTSPYAAAVPAWLNEGNASYWETRDRRDSARRFRSVIRSGTITEFAAMNTVPGLRSDINSFYIQSENFVGYLIENYGPDSIGRLLAQLNDGKRIDDAMIAVYGGTLKQIENDWRLEWGREWGLPSVGSVETPANFHKDLVPTIPGLPTIETGTLKSDTQQPRTGPEDSAQPTPAPIPTSAPQPEPATPPPPQATVAPEPTLVPLTLTPTREEIYFVPGPDDEWPQVKPSAIIVFVLLALGVAAMMYRRMRA